MHGMIPPIKYLVLYEMWADDVMGATLYGSEFNYFIVLGKNENVTRLVVKFNHKGCSKTTTFLYYFTLAMLSATRQMLLYYIHTSIA